jgi:hypothetical protein
MCNKAIELLDFGDIVIHKHVNVCAAKLWASDTKVGHVLGNACAARPVSLGGLATEVADITFTTDFRIGEPLTTWR